MDRAAVSPDCFSSSAVSFQCEKSQYLAGIQSLTDSFPPQNVLQATLERGKTPSNSDSGEDLVPIAVTRKPKVGKLNRTKVGKTDDYQPHSLEEYWLKKEEIDERNSRRRRIKSKLPVSPEASKRESTAIPVSHTSRISVPQGTSRAEEEKEKQRTKKLEQTQSLPAIKTREGKRILENKDAMRISRKNETEIIDLTETHDTLPTHPSPRIGKASPLVSDTQLSRTCKKTSKRRQKPLKRRLILPVTLTLNTPSVIADAYFSPGRLIRRLKTAAGRTN